MRRGATVALVTGALAWAWWRSRPFRVLVEGDSMEPTLSPGDQVVAVRPGRLRVGDVVVVRARGIEMVKRLAVLPGGSVAGRTLGQGEHWVLGDRPGRSTDSRSFGPVREITGVVRYRYLPRPGPVR